MELASESLLREMEQMADTVDLLDAQARVGGEPYADQELDAKLVAKRGRLLLELEVGGVLAPELAGTRATLVALRLPRLLSYHDAAREMTRYFASPGRARLVRTPVPKRINDARVSLDWFRNSNDYTPAGIDPLDWLALCETNFIASERPRVGRVFIKLEGAFHQLWFRSEVGPLAKLYRAEPGQTD
jgi:hypothetical protein